jgi:hypothetical protein
MPVSNEREYRSFHVSELETRDGNDGSMIVEGYATTFNHRYMLYDMGDYAVDEEIAPEAFDKTDMTDVIMQYDHEGRIFARVRNKTLELDVDSHGLHIRAHLEGTDIGRQLNQEIKGGYTDKMSIGFTVAKDEWAYEEDHERNRMVAHRRITAIKKLYDVSAVSLPANDATEISARRLSDGVIAEIKAERLAAEQRARKIAILKLMTEV